MGNADLVEASTQTPNQQQVHLVKPPKKLNELTEEELQPWAKDLGDSFKKNQQQRRKGDE